MSPEVVLFSINPQYANMIFDGSKLVELRRARPRMEPNAWILVYASSPVCSLVGAFQVRRVVETSPNKLWAQVKSDAGITRTRFNAYYEGASNAVGIYIGNRHSFSAPVHLAVLRRTWRDFHPPQSYQYLTYDQVDAFAELKHLINGCA
jgi:predicted transcriptional regulator